MLGGNEVYNWRCLKSIRVMYLNISGSQPEPHVICQVSSGMAPEEGLLWANEQSLLHDCCGHNVQVHP